MHAPGTQIAERSCSPPDYLNASICLISMAHTRTTVFHALPAKDTTSPPTHVSCRFFFFSFLPPSDLKNKIDDQIHPIFLRRNYEKTKIDYQIHPITPIGPKCTCPIGRLVDWSTACLYRWYARIMRELVAYPVPDGDTGDQDFAEFLEALLMDHTCVPHALVRGVLELEEK